MLVLWLRRAELPLPCEVSVYGQLSSTKPVELVGVWEGAVLCVSHEVGEK